MGHGTPSRRRSTRVSPTSRRCLEGRAAYDGAMSVPRLMELVRAEDWDGIEGARDRVRDVSLDELLPEYWRLEGWMQKVAFANLVQDQVHPALRASEGAAKK